MFVRNKLFLKRKQLSSKEFNKINVVGMNCNVLCDDEKGFQIRSIKMLGNNLKHFRHDSFLDLESFFFLILNILKAGHNLAKYH